MKKVWDLTHLSVQDEVRLGEELNTLVLTSTPAVEGGPMPRRLVETADPIVDKRMRKDLDYKFLVLDSEVINAFSHPGGYVYVTKGLMDWVGEDRNFVLEFVVAHEIAHVDQRHAISCLSLNYSYPL